MTGRVILAWIYRCTAMPFFNVTANGYWLARLALTGKLVKAWKAARSGMKASRQKPVPMTYRFDGLYDGPGVLGKWPCWTALPTVFAGMGMRGNCLDAAFYLSRARGGRVWVWIPDGPRWMARAHYACMDSTGAVWALEKKGLHRYESLADCRAGGRWI